MNIAAGTLTIGRRVIREGAKVQVVSRNANGTVTIRVGNFLSPVPAIWVRTI